MNANRPTTSLSLRDYTSIVLTDITLPGVRAVTKGFQTINHTMMATHRLCTIQSQSTYDSGHMGFCRRIIRGRSEIILKLLR